MLLGQQPERVELPGHQCLHAEDRPAEQVDDGLGVDARLT